MLAPSRLFPLFAAVLLGPALGLAQIPAQPQTDTQNKSEEATTDGGGTPDVLESIFIPPLPNAPVSFTLHTEWVRLMNNGGTFASVNARTIRRDSSGRFYQERWFLVPKGSGIPSHMNWIQIADPVARTLYQCSVRQRACELDTWNVPPPGRYRPGAPTRSMPLPNGHGFYSHEDLGTGDVAGVSVQNFRDVTTLNAGVFGNDRPLVTTREFSYAPALGINLRSVLDTPQVGRQEFTATDVTTSEPEPRFFQPPEGYRIIENRHAALAK